MERKIVLSHALTEAYLDNIFLTLEDFKCLNKTLKAYEACKINQEVVDTFLSLMIVNAVSRYENFIKPFLSPFVENDEIFRTNVLSVNNFLMKNLKVNLWKLFRDWEPFVELYYRRNCIVHEGGKVNQNYVRKVPLRMKRALDTYREGSKLVSNSQYVVSRSKILINFQKTLYGSVTSACNLCRNSLHSTLDSLNKKKEYNFNRDFFYLSLNPSRYQGKSYVGWTFDNL